jgi:hypothetical protein
MKPKTFAEIYCERERVSREKFSAVLFRRTLYPHARLVAGIVRRFDPHYFRADDEFIEDVANLQSLPEISLAFGSYLQHPANWGLLRRVFRIRISARRMHRAVRSVFAQPGRPAVERDSFEPFDHPPGES